MDLIQGKAAHSPARSIRAFDFLIGWFFDLPAAVKRPILFFIVFLIVVLPALLYDQATQSAYDASQWVNHTNLVKSGINQMLFDLRDGESALRTFVLFPEHTPIPALRDYQNAIGRLPDDLDQIQLLTSDNPRQQERIGRMRSAINGRTKVMAQVVQFMLAGRRSDAVTLLGQSMEEYPFRETELDMIGDETGLLQERVQTAAERKRTANTLIWAAVIAQLALCVTIYLISERDIRRRQTAEGQSAEASALAQSIVETNPDPLIVLDAAGRVLSFNKAFTNLYGIDLIQARGHFLRSIGQGAWELPNLQQRLADLIPQQREIWDLEVTQDIAGEKRTMLINARPFPGAAGEKLILVAAKDVTARKRSEEQISRLNQELALRVDQTTAVNQELEAFSYSVSHDLRAPLRHITGFGDMLATHLAQNEDPKTQRYLKYIRESANQMGTLIDDLLVFSRMGRTEMTSQEIEMSEQVAEVIRHFGLETEGRQIDFCVDPLPSVKGDPAMMRLVWMNLIGNAIKYSRQRDRARIEIGSKPSDMPERIYFVRDNGVGFNMKYVHKLFGVFQRLHQADEYEGTGIGLANVRRIVQRHGGKVWAQGYVDQGATFYFSIPLEPPPPPLSNK